MDNPQLNVYLADDDEDDCLFFKEALGELTVSAHLTTVHNGEQLMQLLAEESVELPHVLFLDLNMPRKNGYECLLEIKLDEKLKKLPVIIFSTSFEQDVIDLLYENGAHYCTRKPVAFDQFRNLIQQVLTLTVKGINSQPPKENFVLKSDLKPVLP